MICDESSVNVGDSDKQGKNSEYFWGTDQLKKINDSDNEKIKELMDGIINYGTERQLKSDTEDKKHEIVEPVNIKYSIDVFVDEKIAHLILRYLKDCKKAFFTLFNNELSEEQSYLMNIYTLVNENNIERQLEKMQECIEDYKRILQKEIKDTIL